MQDVFSESFFSSVLNVNPGVMYIFNLEQNIAEYISPISKNLTGYTPEELNAMGSDMLFKLINPADKPLLMKHIDAIKHSTVDDIKTFEYRIISKGLTSKTKDLVWAISYHRPFERNRKNEVTKVCGIVLDITKYKNDQIQLSTRNKLLSNIASMNPQSATIINVKSGIIEYSNRDLEQAFGVKMTDENNRPLSIMEISSKTMSEEDQQKVSLQLQNFLPNAAKEPKQLEISYYDNLGKTRWLNWTSLPYRLNVLGEVEAILSFTQEVTESKRNQIKLETKHNELEEITQLSSNDLLEPLKTIQSSLQVLKNELAESDNKMIERCLKMMTDTSESMKQNVNAILDYSKLNADNSFGIVDLNNVLNSVRSALSSSIEKANATIEIDEKLPQINGDSRLISMLFQNLISNAIKFQNNDNQPVVKVSYEKSAIHHIIHVQDNGIGISEASQARIFNMFQKLHSHDQFEGNGIGLAHAIKIMRLHAGELKVKSSLGSGSTFSCHFVRGV